MGQIIASGYNCVFQPCEAGYEWQVRLREGRYRLVLKRGNLITQIFWTDEQARSFLEGHSIMWVTPSSEGDALERASSE